MSDQTEKPEHTSIKSQIKDNAIAIISLVIAISSLSYNSWRNELSEDNRNQRQAAFEIILKINELQQVVFYNHYEQDLKVQGNPRLGWTYVLTIQDLAMVLPETTREAANHLAASWNTHWSTLHAESKSKAAIDEGIDLMRREILRLLSALE